MPLEGSTGGLIIMTGLDVDRQMRSLEQKPCQHGMEGVV